MKTIINKLQKLMLTLVMGAGFLYAVTNVNVACGSWMYQPTPPKALEQYKHLKND